VFALLLSLHVKFANPHTFQKNTKLLNTCSKIAAHRFAISHDQDAVCQQIYDGTPVSDIYSDHAQCLAVSSACLNNGNQSWYGRHN